MSDTYPEIPADRADDLHHMECIDHADLVLFMAGNQFMVMPELVQAFQEEYPEIKHIFYETLPPGLELKQILKGGAMFRGELLRVQPDIYASVNIDAMKTLEQESFISPDNYHLYLHNRLVVMLQEGNPNNINSIEDLGRSDIRISQPDPANEDIAFHIMDMYREAGGEELKKRIMEEKRAEGTTIFTIVHHRETPLRIRLKTVDAGPVWATEAIHAESENLPCHIFDPGEPYDQRDQINYYICKLKASKNSKNADHFLDFIRSPNARDIYRKYGFMPHD